MCYEVQENKQAVWKTSWVEIVPDSQANLPISIRLDSAVASLNLINLYTDELNNLGDSLKVFHLWVLGPYLTNKLLRRGSTLSLGKRTLL